MSLNPNLDYCIDNLIAVRALDARIMLKQCTDRDSFSVSQMANVRKELLLDVFFEVQAQLNRIGVYEP